MMPETSQPAMGPNFFSALAGFLLKSSTASFRESLLVKVPGGGDGGASGGDGGASGGGEGQSCVVTHFLNFASSALNFFSAFLNFFSHFVHFFLLPAASTPVASRSEMRSKIMSFIVCALCVRVYLRTKAMAHDRTRAGGKE